MSVSCPCGCGLKYLSAQSEAWVQRLVDELGETIRVGTPWGTWLVPRHYVALHGIKAFEVPSLAIVNGWERVDA